jgi:hypothetical protein
MKDDNEHRQIDASVKELDAHENRHDVPTQLFRAMNNLRLRFGSLHFAASLIRTEDGYHRSTLTLIRLGAKQAYEDGRMTNQKLRQLEKYCDRFERALNAVAPMLTELDAAFPNADNEMRSEGRNGKS